jgi:hypothetical protein
VVKETNTFYADESRRRNGMAIGAEVDAVMLALTV